MTDVMADRSFTEQEIASQPQVWEQALSDVRGMRSVLAVPGERVLLLGCGTSAFVAMALAWLRARAGLGHSDWAYASELPVGRSYDRVVAISRSGTTTEALEALDAIRHHSPTTRRAVIGAVPGMPIEELADQALMLDFADERSVVQTRFPTAILVAGRAALGEDVAHLPEQCAHALGRDVEPDAAAYQHFVFLGHEWTVGLAHEGALKTREAAQAWAESYPARDYRHGPIAVADRRSLVTMFGPADPSLVADVEAVGATVVHDDRDPVVQLVDAQRRALVVARHRGLDPDQPRHLTRSVVLT